LKLAEDVALPKLVEELWLLRKRCESDHRLQQCALFLVGRDLICYDLQHVILNTDANHGLGLRLFHHGVNEPHDVLLHLFVALGALDLSEQVRKEGESFLLLTEALHSLEDQGDHSLEQLFE
jgi:hypothetical protein